MPDNPKDPSTSERWARVWSLFHQALELPAEERRTFLDEAGSDNDTLRAEVDELLAHHGPGQERLERAPVFAPATPGPPPYQQVGPYRIVERIGEGGMGIVYEAHQLTPVHRRVALKLIKHNAPGRELVVRFAAERQALALMNHPGVARVLDFGETESGHPYYVMEYVEGAPITDYCDEANLPIRKRLELFTRVCDAVQHAHQKGVIHRDLKPSNILVTEEHGEPQPKVIDFGVAKLLEPELAPGTAYTRAGSVLGTPEYMSPEQWLTGIDIDTRTDVYSLGVILYELLTGELPLPLRDLPLAEAARIASQEEARRPSTRISQNSKPIDRAARSRRAEVRDLRKELNGDLDWVVLKAVEKDRDRRYDSAAGLAADIGRHLRHEPVSAGAPGRVYRARKFVRRHRGAVAAGLGLLAALLIGLAGTARMAQIAAGERDRAQREADTNRATVAFLQEMLGGAESRDWRRMSVEEKDLRVIDVIRRAEQELGDAFEDQPLVEATLALTLGQALNSLSELEAAHALLRRSVEIRSRHLADTDPALLQARFALAYSLSNHHGCAEAEGIYRGVFDAREEQLGFDHPLTLRAARGLGICLGTLGRFDEKAVLLERVAQVYRRELETNWDDPPLDIFLLQTMMYNTGADEATTGRPEDHDLLRELVAARQTRLGPEHRATLEAKWALSTMISGTSPEEAEILCREMESAYRVVGDAEGTVDAAACLYVALEGQGAWREAEVAAREYRDAYEALYEPEWFNPGTTLLIRALHFGGKVGEAEQLARSEYSRRAERLAAGDHHLWTGITYVFWSLKQQGRFDEAETFLFRHANDPQVQEDPEIGLRAARLAVMLYRASGETDKLDAARKRLEEVTGQGSG